MPPFDPFNHFTFLTHRVSRLLDIITAEMLQRNGFTFPTSCIGILADLYAKDGVLQKDLGHSIVRYKSTITKLLDALESNHLIVRKEDEEDKRSKLIYLTDKGRSVCDKLKEESDFLIDDSVLNISETELIIAKRVLRKQYENCYSFLEKSDFESSSL